MKHNWEYKQFTDIATSITPRIKVDKSDYLLEGPIPIISQEESYISGYWDNLDDITPHNGPVIIFGDHSRVLKYVDCDFVVGADGVKIISPKDCICAKFLFHFLKWYNIPSLGYSRHFKLIKDATFPVPPREVQERIVAELDKINETIEDCRELLRNLDALKLSLFYDYFGDPNTNPKNWNISTFGEIGTFIRGGGFLKRDFVDFGIPCIHYGQIHTKFGEVVRKNLTYISEYTALKSKFAKPNDVILAITSEDLEGSCKSVAWLGDFEVAVGGHAAIFTHNQNPVFISFYTRSNAFCIEKEKYAHGSKVVEIRPKDIEKIPIYLPPLELQEKFAERIEQIEEQKKTVESTIAELQTLLDSCMDYWFN